MSTTPTKFPTKVTIAVVVLVIAAIVVSFVVFTSRVADNQLPDARSFARVTTQAIAQDALSLASTNGADAPTRTNVVSAIAQNNNSGSGKDATLISYTNNELEMMIRTPFHLTLCTTTDVGQGYPTTSGGPVVKFC